MDTNFFLTISTQTLQPASIGNTGKEFVPGQKSEKFSALFDSFLQQGLISKEGKIMVDQISKDNQELNEQLNQSVSTLESLLSEDLNTADLYNIEDFSETPLGQIIASINSDGVALNDTTKLAIVDRLIGTPVKIKISNETEATTTIEGIKSPDITSNKSPFANTEATLNADDLFERILQNLNQDQGIKIALESIIATGLTPQEIEIISDKPSISLQKPENTTSINDDLIALLGLTQSLPVQSVLTSQSPKQNDPLKAQTLWFNEDLDGLPLENKANSFSELKAAMENLPAQAKAGMSKAAEIISATANENAVNHSMPSFIGALNNESPTDWIDIDGQEWIATPTLPSALNGTNLVSIVTQAPHAHSAHPATQMLALSIQKNSTNVDSRNWTLQLDPPDLGKVEVELSFSKDKLVKTHMIIEKPETWMMLQRDAQVLERALQEAGLDVSSEDMQFELASQDHDFTGNGSHDGQSSGGEGSATDEDIEIIETTMTWYTDAESGLQRYDLVV